MGTINQGILGGVSGTVGSVVGASWKGISYLRGKATSYSNPNTESQQATRKTFRKLVKLSSALLGSVVRPIWSKRATQKTGSNVFISTNFRNVDPDLPLADNENMVMSVGSLPLPDNITVQRNVAVPRGVTINWTDNSGNFMAAADDILRIVAIAGDNAIAFNPVGVTRADGSAEIVLPFPEGQTVRVFIFFQNAALGLFSNDKNFALTA